MSHPKKAVSLLLMGALAASSAGCEAKKRRRAAFDEAKNTITALDAALGQKLQADSTFCPAPKDGNDAAAWKCLGIAASGTYCKHAYSTNGKDNQEAEATFVATCVGNPGDPEMKFTLKVKGTLTGDVERISLEQPERP